MQRSDSNSGRGSVTRIEINGLRLVPPLGNLLLLGHVCLACVSTVSITTSKDNQLHEEAHAQHRPFQEMFKAMEREEAVCEARTTNKARGERVQARSHSAAATHFYPARASSAGSGDRAQGRACYLGNFIARLRNPSLKILVMMTQKTRETKTTAID